jgi:hypothetical protein
MWGSDLPAGAPATEPHTKAREGTEGNPMTLEDSKA